METVDVDQGCQMDYFKTKNPISGKFSVGLVMEDVDMFYGHSIYFTANWYVNMYINSIAIRYILWSFGVYILVLVFCTKINLATLMSTTEYTVL
jgi:hypothetical protein